MDFHKFVWGGVQGTPRQKSARLHLSEQNSFTTLGDPMATPCNCFGRNENCRLCEGTGIISSEAETKFLQPKAEFTALSFPGKTYEEMRADAKAKYQPAKAGVVASHTAVYQPVKAAVVVSETAVEYWKNRFKKMRAAKK